MPAPATSTSSLANKVAVCRARASYNVQDDNTTISTDNHECYDEDRDGKPLRLCPLNVAFSYRVAPHQALLYYEK